MNKIKAWFVAAVIVILAAGFVISLHSYAIWSYHTVMQVLGWYGLLQAGVHIAAWLQKEEPEHQRRRVDWSGQ